MTGVHIFSTNLSIMVLYSMMKGVPVKKTVLTLFLILLFLGGCRQKQESQAEHDAKIAQQARAQLLQELKAKEEAECRAEKAADKSGKFAQMGIETMPDGKIVIDTNRTKTYFRKLTEHMREKMKRLSKDMQKGVIDEKEAGIEVNETHIEIDLNKSRTFLEKWSQKMEEFVKEFDKIANEIDKKAKGQ